MKTEKNLRVYVVKPTKQKMKALRVKRETAYGCLNCGYVIHLAYIPFKHIITKCPNCGHDEFKRRPS